MLNLTMLFIKDIYFSDFFSSIKKCKVHAHIGIKGNEEVNKVTRLPYTDYFLTIKSARNSKWQNSNSKLHYITF